MNEGHKSCTVMCKFNFCFWAKLLVAIPVLPLVALIASLLALGAGQFAVSFMTMFAAIAVVYWLVPAGSLPGVFPGFEAGSPRVHVKHGLAAAAVAVVLFAIAWYAGRSRG